MKHFTTPLQAIEWAEKYFIQSEIFLGHGTSNPQDEALWLVMHVLGLSWDSSDNELEKALAETEYSAILNLFERRVRERLPAAYLTGQAWFAGIDFEVTPDVLVPRSPIAELIDNHFQPWVLPPRKVLDLCTGSGCIGIAIALHMGVDVDLSDISPEALEVARRNVSRHNVGDCVNVIQSDGFDNIHQTYDLIVSNPPYVDETDLANMPLEYHAEPAIGLASGKDGLDFTRKLLSQASSYLSESGSLVVEVGNSAEALQEAFPNVPFMWFEFERGGHGVFLLTKQELKAHFS